MNVTKYKVVEIFKSIEGEGKRAGLPATFVRLYGCNLRCGYCDTLYGITNNNYELMSAEDILFELKRHKCQRVTLTGGEPLIQPGVDTLIDLMIKNDFYVNIETNGAVDIKPYLTYPNLLITVDYKCPSSGMEDKMLMSNFEYVRPGDVVKFVVGSKEDLAKATHIIKYYGLHNAYLSPVFGEIEPKDIVDHMMNNGLNDVRVQLQLHKYIWDPEMKGV